MSNIKTVKSLLLCASIFTAGCDVTAKAASPSPDQPSGVVYFITKGRNVNSITKAVFNSGNVYPQELLFSVKGKKIGDRYEGNRVTGDFDTLSEEIQKTQSEPTCNVSYSFKGQQSGEDYSTVDIFTGPERSQMMDDAIVGAKNLGASDLKHECK